MTQLLEYGAAWEVMKKETSTTTGRSLTILDHSLTLLPGDRDETSPAGHVHARRVNKTYTMNFCFAVN